MMDFSGMNTICAEAPPKSKAPIVLNASMLDSFNAPMRWFTAIQPKMPSSSPVMTIAWLSRNKKGVPLKNCWTFSKTASRSSACSSRMPAVARNQIGKLPQECSRCLNFSLAKSTRCAREDPASEGCKAKDPIPGVTDVFPMASGVTIASGWQDVWLATHL